MGITLKNNKPVTKNMTIKGDDGVGIKTITSGTPVVTEEKTTTPITVTLTDETTQNFNVEAQNGSGGTGTKKYTHIITMGGSTHKFYISLKLTSTSNEIFTENKLVEYFYNIGCNSKNSLYPVSSSNIKIVNNEFASVYGIYAKSAGGSLYCAYNWLTFEVVDGNISIATSNSFGNILVENLIDNVIEE